jgi:hypothetical protein
MNRKTNFGALALILLAVAFLTNCDSSSSSHPVASKNFSFSVSGLENANGGPNFYAVAGSVSIDSKGNVIKGVQDYNDGFGFTSPQPSGDTIVGGKLTADPVTGQGTLTLVTNNTNLGSAGTETFGVQFVNTSHALIIQFDGTATSSGSMDLQTLPSTLGGGYAFTLSGVDTGYNPVVFGGVFSLAGTALQNGTYDVNDAGTVELGTAFTGTVSSADSFGRGTISGTGIATVNYYIIGPEAMRLIVVDTDSSGIGTAYGQGSGTFSATSLGSSIFGVEANNWGFIYAATGQLTVPASGTIVGVADNDEEGTVTASAPISGTYAIASNGYGNLALSLANGPQGTVGIVSALGIYMVDPTLNLNDPNNKVSGLGGALVADLDVNLIGTGVLIPQTDTAVASFAGNYAFGAQNFFASQGDWEFDMIGQGSVTAGTLAGTGLLNDPGAFFAAAGTYSGVAFSGLATPDIDNLGRYTIPLLINPGVCSGVTFNQVVYQASGEQLLWMDEDGQGMSLGFIEQQGSLTGLSAAKRTMTTAKARKGGC